MNFKFNRSVDRMRIIVLGYILRLPLGGLAWHHLQYVLGLTYLGHDVYYVEDSGDYPWACYDPTRQVMDADPTYGLQFTTRTFESFGLPDRWAYHDAFTSRWYGPCADRVESLCATANIVINLSGENPLRSWLMQIPMRIYIDTDPVFTQIRHLVDSSKRDRAEQHTSFFSFGERIWCTECGIPNDGFAWRATRQPVVLGAWPVTLVPLDGKFTTVMQWDNAVIGVPREYQRRFYGTKADSFRPYLDLPERVEAHFEIALGGSRPPRDLLLKKGWELRNPLEGDLSTYQNYIQNSKAEFSIAKHAYVVSLSGWFSERSACYLASGRPVVVQDTGFSDWLETGAGVIAFSTPEEAIAGIEEINSHYDFHCNAAREIAEEYFDSRKVLSRLIEYAMSTATVPMDSKSSTGS